jgi:hypothetical protein
MFSPLEENLFDDRAEPKKKQENNSSISDDDWGA